MALGRRLGSPALKDDEDPLVEEQEERVDGDEGDGEVVGVGGSSSCEEGGRMVRGRGVTPCRGKRGWKGGEGDDSGAGVTAV